MAMVTFRGPPLHRTDTTVVSDKRTRGTVCSTDVSSCLSVPLGREGPQRVGELKRIVAAQPQHPLAAGPSAGAADLDHTHHTTHLQHAERVRI